MAGDVNQLIGRLRVQHNSNWAPPVGVVNRLWALLGRQEPDAVSCRHEQGGGSDRSVWGLLAVRGNSLVAVHAESIDVMRFHYDAELDPRRVEELDRNGNITAIVRRLSDLVAVEAAGGGRLGSSCWPGA